MMYPIPFMAFFGYELLTNIYNKKYFRSAIWVIPFAIATSMRSNIKGNFKSVILEIKLLKSGKQAEVRTLDGRVEIYTLN